MAFRFIDKKHKKQFSNSELSELAEVCLIALGDLEIRSHPSLGKGIGSLFPSLDVDDDTKEHLVSLLLKCSLKTVTPRSRRLECQRLGWQNFLCSNDALRLVPLFKKYAPNPKLGLMRFCKWLGIEIAEPNVAGKLIEAWCPDLVNSQPAFHTLRLFLSREKPALYRALVSSERQKVMR